MRPDSESNALNFDASDLREKGFEVFKKSGEVYLSGLKQSLIFFPFASKETRDHIDRLTALLKGVETEDAALNWVQNTIGVQARMVFGG